MLLVETVGGDVGPRTAHAHIDACQAGCRPWNYAPQLESSTCVNPLYLLWTRNPVWIWSTDFGVGQN